MRYYIRHLGDYARDCGHLTLLEHGVYSRLLDLYYTREGPLLEEGLARLIGAKTQAEVDALDSVLDEFFEPDNDSEGNSTWLHCRCERELSKSRSKIEKATQSARARWQQRQPAESPESNTASTADAMRTHSERNAEALLPNTQYPIPKEAPASLSPRAHAPAPAHPRAREAGEACKAMKRAGLGLDVNPGHPELLDMLEAGITQEELVAAAADAATRGKGFVYALRTAAGRRREAAAQLTIPNAPASGLDRRQLRDREVIAALAPALLPQTPGAVSGEDLPRDSLPECRLQGGSST